jgi:hypothetical protein
MLIPMIVAAVLGAGDDFAPGDWLVCGFGDAGAGSIGHYAADGTFIQQFTGPGEYWEGATLLPDGRVATTRRFPNGVNIWTSDGVLTTFDVNAVAFLPGDVNVFQDGTLAISDQDGDVDLYTTNGVYQGSIGGATRYFGGDVDSQNRLWVADPGIDGDPPVVHVLTQDGTLLDTIPLTFACGDLVVLDDGTFWISDYEGNVARRMNAAGDVLEQFNVPQIPGPFYTIAIAADGTFIMGGSPSFSRAN